MKIAIVGIQSFPFGKKKLADERVEALAEILHPAKITHISLETVPEENLLDADGIIALKENKLDLIIKDLEIVEEKLAVDPTSKEMWQRAKDILEKERFLIEDDVKVSLKDYPLVTLKPILLVEDGNTDYEGMIKEIYNTINMICFFTANEKELRAWQIIKGTSAYEAAGKVHSDIQRGFIKAEVIKAKDLVEYKHINELKSRNLIYLKDKDYVVEDGDLIKFRFSV